MIFISIVLIIAGVFSPSMTLWKPAPNVDFVTPNQDDDSPNEDAVNTTNNRPKHVWPLNVVPTQEDSIPSTLNEMERCLKLTKATPQDEQVLRECLFYVLKAILPGGEHNLEGRVGILEDTLGRYGIHVIAPRLGDVEDVEELLSRIVKLERQLANHKQRQIDFNKLNWALHTRLEEQEERFKTFEAMVEQRFNMSMTKPPEEKPQRDETTNEIVDPKKQRTKLHVAAEEGNVNVARDLLKRGANTEVRDHKLFTPLHLSAWKGHSNVVNLLLDNDAEIDARDVYEYTPLHWAVQYNHVACVLLLLNGGANLEAKDRNGETPLHKAAWQGVYEIMDTLLKKGANVNAVRNQGFTVLHVAAMKDCEECVRLLLRSGADVMAVNNDGMDASAIALDKNLLKISQIIDLAKRKFSPLRHHF